MEKVALAASTQGAKRMNKKASLVGPKLKLVGPAES